MTTDSRTARCVYCEHQAPVGDLEPINNAPSGNLACRDTKACMARQYVQTVMGSLTTDIGVLVEDNPGIDREAIVAELVRQLADWLPPGHPIRSAVAAAAPLPIIVTEAQATKVAALWALNGRPDHPFTGGPGERWCRVCAGGPDGIQHRELSYAEVKAAAAGTPRTAEQIEGSVRTWQCAHCGWTCEPNSMSIPLEEAECDSCGGELTEVWI